MTTDRALARSVLRIDGNYNAVRPRDFVFELLSELSPPGNSYMPELPLNRLTLEEPDPSDLRKKDTPVVNLKPLRETERINGFPLLFTCGKFRVSFEEVFVRNVKIAHLLLEYL
jgi:hypothetical protein